METGLARCLTAREQIVVLDHGNDPVLNRRVSEEYWESIQGAGTLALTLKAEQVYLYRESQVVLEGGRKGPKFHLWTISWEEFCLRHLRMDSSEASDLKRIWEVYTIKCGFALDDLLRAGESKLRTALRTVDVQYPNCDEQLLRLLFGRPHHCRGCGVFVAFPGEEVPISCPSCSKPFEGQPPGTFAEVLALCQAIRQGAPVVRDRLDVDVTYDEEEKRIQVLISADLAGQCYSVPAWTITPLIYQEVVGSPGTWGLTQMDENTFGLLFQTMRRKLTTGVAKGAF